MTQNVNIAELELNFGQIEGLPANPRTIDEDKFNKLKQSLIEDPEMLELRELIVFPNDGKYVIVGGNMRYRASMELGYKELPCKILPAETPVEKLKAYTMKDNISYGAFDWDMLANEWDEEQLAEWGLDVWQPENDISDDDTPGIAGQKETHGSLADKFGIPPFSVLNAREAWWQDRKKQWINLGIKSELGRGDNVLYKSEIITSPGMNYYRDKEKSKFGKCLETGIGEKYGKKEMNGTSIFDPVLCELAYEWFAPKGGVVLDCFAGGSVRGVVAAHKGLLYYGCDLRAEQIEANKMQGEEICNGIKPVWHCGDSLEIDKHFKGIEADLLFSCPPYADLEVYSDNPKDLSTMDYDKFRDVYSEIIKKSCSLLKDNSFAVFVVGEVRDKNGNYYNFVGDTIQAFINAGLQYYNEAVLLTMIGTLPIRSAKAFNASRKLGKTHQNILVFVKGDVREAVKRLGECAFGEIGEPDIDEAEEDLN